MLCRLFADRRALGALEYAILLGVLVAVATLALGPLSKVVSETPGNIADRVMPLLSNVGST